MSHLALLSSAVTTLHLHDNALTDLNALQHTLSRLPSLTELSAYGNPLCSDSSEAVAVVNGNVSGSTHPPVSAQYRLRLLENPNLTVLDDSPIKSYVRAKVCRLLV